LKTLLLGLTIFLSFNASADVVNLIGEDFKGNIAYTKKSDEGTLRLTKLIIDESADSKVTATFKVSDGEFVGFTSIYSDNLEELNTILSDLKSRKLQVECGSKIEHLQKVTNGYPFGAACELGSLQPLI
jgi:hypothetical protein